MGAGKGGQIWSRGPDIMIFGLNTPKIGGLGGFGSKKFLTKNSSPQGRINNSVEDLTESFIHTKWDNVNLICKLTK